MALEPRVGSFANPVADQPGSMVLGDEPADGKKGAVQASFEVEGETTPSSANGAARGTSRSPSPAGARASLRGSISTALVVPESLETEEGTEEVERWKDTLVEHAVAGKENHRDRKKRLAANSLERSNVIDPNGHFRRKWDFIQMLLLTYVAFGVPYRIGFAHHVLLWSGWFWFDVFCDLFFVADIWVSFRTAFYNVRAELVVEQRLISKHYLRTWFVVDVAACLPVHYITFALNSEGDSSTRMVKLLRMLRLLKLLRLARINRLLQRYEEEFASLMTTFKLGKLVIIIFVIGHWLSCLFYGLGSIETFLHDWDAGVDAVRARILVGQYDAG